MDDRSAVPPAAVPVARRPQRGSAPRWPGCGDDEELILAALTECGVAAQVKIIPARRDVQPSPGSYSSPCRCKASHRDRHKDRGRRLWQVHQAAGRLLDRHRSLRTRPHRVPPVLILQDPATGLRIVFEPDRPMKPTSSLLPSTCPATGLALSITIARCAAGDQNWTRGKPQTRYSACRHLRTRPGATGDPERRPAARSGRARPGSRCPSAGPPAADRVRRSWAFPVGYHQP